jgi:predicted NBD/HSP70 family sugar kinase
VDANQWRRSGPVGPDLSGTNLERAGEYNQRVILQAIRVNGPLTRADLADMTNLTAPTIGNITKRLLTQGFILEAGRQHGGRGQPAMRLVINPDGAFSIGVNIDRDHITVVALDLAGNVRARSSREVSFPLPGAVRTFFNQQIKSIMTRSGVQRSRVIGIGVAAPDDLGRVNLPHRPPNYGVWDQTDLSKIFSEALSLPVLVENDAVAAAIGELQFGHGLDAPSFFYILISAGLGGGVVIEGSYYRGSTGRSGELGFLPISRKGGGARSLQDLVSLSALYELLAAAGYEISAPDKLAALDKGGAAVVTAWIDSAANQLLEPLLAVNCLLNPDAVFLGGRLPASLVDRLAERINARLPRHAGDVPFIAPVRRAAMAADAPAIGAAILPFNAQLLPSRAALMKPAAGA